jgi:hypothetical protein
MTKLALAVIMMMPLALFIYIRRRGEGVLDGGGKMACGSGFGVWLMSRLRTWLM